MNEIKKINVGGVEYNIVSKELTKVTYAELKALRDNGQLSEGHLYRITDYVTTTTQAETKSAGNMFDVIVLATSTNELSHIARAIQHEEDTYFDGNDLGAWELWYDLDNDTKKYEWADATNGKGVIYRMIDEKRNDCPYDFKNILFYNAQLIDSATSDKYYYTFSYVVSGKLYDGTVEKQVTRCHDNTMEIYASNEKRLLNRNVFRNTSFGNVCSSNTFGTYCYNNTFGNSCYRNTFGDSCNSNTFGNSCDSNTLGRNCYANTFGNSCGSNTFGDICYGNTFGKSCGSNTFGNSCGSNTFGNVCSSNTFGYNCDGNTLGNQCEYNTFGNYCYSNTFGDSCESHTFGNYCYLNTFGSYCYSNTFCNYCESNTFGDYSSRNTFGDYCVSRHIDCSKTSITLNDEYYDDRSGRLVPIKHPDLSTQPSILPYKFMGQYVYEQLIPIVDYFVTGPSKNEAHFSKSQLMYDKPVFLESSVVFAQKRSDGCLMTPCEIYEQETPFAMGTCDFHAKTNVNIGDYKGIISFIRVVYTSMPEEGGYYGYNNYGGNNMDNTGVQFYVEAAANYRAFMPNSNGEELPVLKDGSLTYIFASAATIQRLCEDPSEVRIELNDKCYAVTVLQGSGEAYIGSDGRTVAYSGDDWRNSTVKISIG